MRVYYREEIVIEISSRNLVETRDGKRQDNGRKGNPRSSLITETHRPQLRRVRIVIVPRSESAFELDSESYRSSGQPLETRPESYR